MKIKRTTITLSDKTISCMIFTSSNKTLGQGLGHLATSDEPDLQHLRVNVQSDPLSLLFTVSKKLVAH